jgi:Ras-related protein Rab-32
MLRLFLTSVTRIYYRDAVGAIIVFDLTKKKTFEAVETWKKDIEDKLDSEDEIPILLIGNKSDLLRDNPPCVEQEELQKYAEDQGFINWFVSFLPSLPCLD